jgi:hypothetical protein
VLSNPCAEYFHLFFGELAQLLSRDKLLSSQRKSAVPSRVGAQHQRRKLRAETRARIDEAANKANGGQEAGSVDAAGRVVHWRRASREWRAVLRRTADAPLTSATPALPASPRSFIASSNEIRGKFDTGCGVFARAKPIVTRASPPSSRCQIMRCVCLSNCVKTKAF